MKKQDGTFNQDLPWGRAIRTIRAWNGDSARELSEVSGLSENQILAVERGSRRPTQAIVEGTCGAYGIEISDLELLTKNERALEKILSATRKQRSLVAANTQKKRQAGKAAA